jgi:hypothetical protein
MRKVEIALLVLTVVAWIAAWAKWNQQEDLIQADVLIILAAPVLTIVFLIVVVMRFVKPTY